MATVWNSADKSANITLSNTDHTATSDAGAGNEGVQSTGSGHSTGKWYIEFFDITTGGNTFGIGFHDTSLTLGNDPQFRVTQDGTTFVPSGGSFAQPGTSPVGVNVSFAIDLDALRGYIRYDGGSWYGPAGAGADPVAGTGGFDLTSAGLPWLPTLRVQFDPRGATMNAGDSGFTYGIPSGFAAWDATGIPPTVARAMMVG